MTRFERSPLIGLPTSARNGIARSKIGSAFKSFAIGAAGGFAVAFSPTVLAATVPDLLNVAHKETHTDTGMCKPATDFSFEQHAEYADAGILNISAQIAVSSQANTALPEIQSIISRGSSSEIRAALIRLRSLLQNAQARGDEEGAANILGVMGLAYSALGEVVQARNVFSQSIVAATNVGASGTLARSQFNEANLLLAQADLSIGAAGVQGARSRGAVSLSAGGASAVTTTPVENNNAEEVIEKYIAAAVAAEQAGARLLQARALLYASRLVSGSAEDRSDYAEALTLIRQSKEAARLSAASQDREMVRIGLGDALLYIAEASSNFRSRALRESADILIATIESAGANGDYRSESFARGALSKVYLANNDYGSAITVARQALLLAQQENALDLTFQWRGLIADILRRQKDFDGATSLYEAAINDVNEIRGSLAAVDPVSGRSLFRSIVEPLYLSYADLLMAGATGASEQRLLRQARETVDALKAVELEQYFQDDCVSGLLIDSLQETPGNVAILYPIMLDDRLELIVETDKGLFRATEKVRPREIADASAQLREALIASPSNNADYRTPAAQLYQWLIHPIENELDSSIDTLVFAPDAALRGVPLGALIDANGEFLVKRYATATAISTSLIAEPQQRQSNERRALYASLGLAQGGFSQLLAVGDEITASQEIFRGPDPLQNKDFTERRLADALSDQQVDIIHFATHATFGGRSENSFLLAYGEANAEDTSDNGRITINELEAMISTARIRGGDIELITLSACETAAGNDQSVLGLAGVAYKSGARSVLASLWAINDAGTAEFVPNIYRAMQQGTAKAQALKQAQLQFLNSESELAHPYYWAPFILLGEWD